MLMPEGPCPCGVQQPGQHQGLMQNIAMHCSETLGGRSPLPSAAPERWHGDTRGQGQGRGGQGERDELELQESSSTAGRGHCGQQLELGRKRSAVWKNRATSPHWKR